MAILFIDSTYDVAVGLLKTDHTWLEFNTFAGPKASSILQKETSLLLKKFNLKAKQLNAVVTVAGPGFYTGLRFSEGFADIFSFLGIPHFSFYTYEIPKLCGYESGFWITKAYRGEIFIHEWDKTKEVNKLFKNEQISSNLFKSKHNFVHSEKLLDSSISKYLENAIFTNDLLKRSPQVIFPQVIREKLSRPSFYFRAPEDEFRVNP